MARSRGSCSACVRTFCYIPWIAAGLSVIAIATAAVWATKTADAGRATSAIVTDLGASENAVLQIDTKYRNVTGVTVAVLVITLLCGLGLSIARSVIANRRDAAVDKQRAQKAAGRGMYVTYRTFMTILIVVLILLLAWLTALLALQLVWAVVAKVTEEGAKAGAKVVRDLVSKVAAAGGAQAVILEAASQAAKSGTPLQTALLNDPRVQALSQDQQAQLKSYLAAQNGTGSSVLSGYCAQNFCLDLSPLKSVLSLNSTCLCDPQIIFAIQDNAHTAFQALVPAITLLYICYLACLLILVKYARDQKGASKDGWWLRAYDTYAEEREIDDKMNRAALPYAASMHRHGSHVHDTAHP